MSSPLPLPPGQGAGSLPLPPSRGLAGTVAIPQGMSPRSPPPYAQGGAPGDRGSYDGAAGDLATAVYRRDNTGANHPIVKVPDEPKKKSAAPFVIGMIALAAVGFSLVALIINYVQTGRLPWR